MEAIKFFRKKIILFLICTGLGFIFFSAVKNVGARENAFVACLIDDEACMYKTQVLYSGTEIEYGRIVNFNNVDLRITNPTSLLSLSSYGGSSGNRTWKINQSTGKISVTVNDVDGRSISSDEWADLYNTTAYDSDVDNEASSVVISWFIDRQGELSNEENSTLPAVLTFPTNQNTSAGESDINRAYSVADTLGENYRDALLYVNDGKSFESVDALIDTAYALVSTNNGIMTNQYGNQYSVTYNGDGNGNYSYKCHITRVTGDSSAIDKEMDFVYALKKGYLLCDDEDYFEDGTANNLSSEKTSEGDTVYITWQQFFLEAGIFYAEGVSYSNQADLYELADFEKSMVETFRNFLSGIQNKLQLYTIEDCIFNNSIRGSQAFVFGVYQMNFNNAIFRFFMIMLAIALCLTTIAIINMILKKQWSLASPISRYSMMNGIKDIIISLFIMSFLWVLMRFVFVINYKFVNIWNTYLQGKTMSQVGGYSSLSAILYAFVFFIIRTYVNVIYILRGLIVPVLMIISPVCVFVYCMGLPGKKVTFAWLKEFLGNVFIQSFHALAYGFILASCNGLRGIEALCVYASIIPLTSVIRQITGLGGGELLKKGSQLTTAVGSTIGAGVQAGASIKASATIADAQEKAAKVSTTGSVLGSVASAGGSLAGAAFGSVLGPAGTAVGAAIGGGIGSVANGAISGASSVKAAGIIADATKEAGQMTAAGSMFNAGMGLAMNTVLDSGDGGATQAGMHGIEMGERQKQEARGRYAEQRAQAINRAVDTAAGGVSSAVTRGTMIASRGAMMGGTASAESGMLPGITEGKFQSFNAPGYTNGVSDTFSKNLLSSYSPVKEGSLNDSNDGFSYNYQDYAINKQKMREIKAKLPDAVKNSVNSEGKFDASSGTFADLAKSEANSPSFYAAATEYAKENDRSDVMESLRSSTGVNNMEYRPSAKKDGIDTLRVTHNPDTRTTAEKATYKRTQIMEEQMGRMRVQGSGNSQYSS